MFERGITVISGPVGDHHRQDSSSDNDRKFRAAPIQTDVARGRLIAWSCPPECISLKLGCDALLGYQGDSPPRDGAGFIFFK
jgi:hypothetical protein